jgi:hypothetical protein
MLRLLADENVSAPILRGLLRRRPSMDIARVQDVGLEGAADPRVLDWAAKQERIVLTQDFNTMIGFCWDRVGAGEQMPGLFVVRYAAPRIVVIEGLLLMDETTSLSEWANRVTFLPL